MEAQESLKGAAGVVGAFPRRSPLRSTCLCRQGGLDVISGGFRAGAWGIQVSSPAEIAAESDHGASAFPLLLPDAPVSSSKPQTGNCHSSVWRYPSQLSTATHRCTSRPYLSATDPPGALVCLAVSTASQRLPK
ncbi:hypothetical protein VTN96DRAFT_7433 [Rasamsonia emersonii]